MWPQEVWPQDECRIKHWIEGPDFLKDDVTDYKLLFDSPKDSQIELEVKANSVESDIQVKVNPVAHREQVTPKEL